MAMQDRQESRNLERRKYEAIWSWPRYVKARSKVSKYAPHIKDRARGAIFDLGCGTGHTAQFLGATGVDIAYNCLQVDIPFICQALWEPLPPFDYAVCLDVLEHIPPERIDDVVANVKAPHGFALVATNKDRLTNGQLHLIVEGASWWDERMGMEGRVIENAIIYEW